jgi:nitrogen fixation protein NifZ
MSNDPVSAVSEIDMKPLYELGQEVRVIRNVRNDGTFPGRDPGELLLRRGATGFVRDIGTFLQDEIIYSVDFIKYGYRVGCREPELIDAEEVWVPNRYEFRDKVTFGISLSVKGVIVAKAGDEGEVLMVEREMAKGIHYHVHINGRTLLVAENDLTGVSDFDERVQKTIAKGIDANAATQGATLPWKSL